MKNTLQMYEFSNTTASFSIEKIQLITLFSYLINIFSKIHSIKNNLLLFEKYKSPQLLSQRNNYLRGEKEKRNDRPSNHR